MTKDRRDLIGSIFFNKQKTFSITDFTLSSISSEGSDCPSTNFKKKLVSGRSEPSSRTFLIGEQPNALQLLHRRAKVSRHRGAELRRRYELLGGTSLLSLEQLLSVNLPPRLTRVVGSLCSAFA